MWGRPGLVRYTGKLEQREYLASDCKSATPVRQQEELHPSLEGSYLAMC
jgi:hypothetical protein